MKTTNSKTVSVDMLDALRAVAEKRHLAARWHRSLPALERRGLIGWEGFRRVVTAKGLELLKASP